MNYGKLAYCDTANGPSFRTVLFVTGCRHHCKGCFNKDTWDFQYGKPFTNIEINKILESLKPAYIDGITILGGEPMEPENQPYIHNLVKLIRETYPTKTIWVYSGYTYEEMLGIAPSPRNMTDDSTRKSLSYTQWTNEILDNIDILVDGEFKMKEKNLRLAFRGSANQRIIDMKQTRKNGHIVLSDYMNLQNGTVMNTSEL